MPRLRHGEIREVETTSFIANTLSPRRRLDYGFIFPGLASDPAARLPETPDMARRLFALASVMTASHGDASRADSDIPAVYTYFGQFIDHDITLEQSTIDGENLALNIVPLENPASSLANARNPTLDLDCVYAPPAPRDPADAERMLVGQVSTSPPRPPGRDTWNDLPRQARNRTASEDRAALIGDPRNDENLVVAQLHVAFLRAHNALVERGKSFAEARDELRLMYQSAIFGDFLPRLVDPDVLANTLKDGPRIWRCAPEDLFVPLEFAVAGYRFGHSLVRSAYDVNGSFGFTGRLGAAPLAAMFTFTAMSGNFDPTRDFDTLPENWIVEWPRFISVTGAATPTMTRRIGTTLSPGLDELRDFDGNRLPEPVAVRLAARNLLRGYRLRLPTGQAVARAIGVEPLAGKELLQVLPLAQRALVDNLGFADRTPLWFYILAEAEDPRGGRSSGCRLGTVGSTIVVETLINLAKAAGTTIFPASGERPDTPWTLLDILRLGNVVD